MKGIYLKVKVVLLLFVLVAFITACDFDRNGEGDLLVDSIVKYRGEQAIGYNVRETQFSIEFPGITNYEMALNIANSIMAEMYEGFVPRSVFFEPEQQAWIIIYISKAHAEEFARGKIVLGGGISIALCATDGRVLNIWPGE